jgi:UDP-N-acetylglucosamine/UDP-N-acetylgalactosamine diphosphorylase
MASGKELINRLQEKGVKIPCPESVHIEGDISPDRISGEGVVIHAGCKLIGFKTLIMDHVELGYEGPATIHDCQLGSGVRLGGGFFKAATFLDRASMGPEAHVREGCLLEEHARGAHAVGLKQTILFPFVTLGSLINYCDCLTAGGTDRKNHSEVGSAYIHFNFTPDQDKATPSLIGDVPRGVMLNQPPIFLGGQGGMVGPIRVEYGTVVAAGTILRKDLLEGDKILLGQAVPSKSLPFHRGLYSNIKRIISHNTNYIANILALRRWYLDIRIHFLGKAPNDRILHEGAVEKLETALEERIKRLREVAERMPQAIEIYRRLMGERASEKAIRVKQDLYDRWPEMEQTFRECMDWPGDTALREIFMGAVDCVIQDRGKDYIEAIRGLRSTDAETGVSWLQGLVNEINGKVGGVLSPQD